MQESLRWIMQEQDRDYLIMASKIRSCLETENGKTLHNWLAGACFMDSPMNGMEIESTAQLQRINARRDLFIALQQVISDGGTFNE